ncbi:DEAD/DEAH box helicase domain protein, partial [Haloferax sp. BAB-2207]
MDVDLDFIELTREEIVDAEVDILLTNPDTVNYRLFNINEQDEQAVFVTEPKYVVFDEIHEYSELFGSFTATLMRRYLRSRRSLLGLNDDVDDDLRLVGASATVENKRAIFQRINPFTDADITVVEEDPRTLECQFPDDLPAPLVERTADPGLLADTSSKWTPAESLVADVIGELPSNADSGERRRIAGDRLYDTLLDERGDDLDIVRALYTTLHEEAQRPADLRETLSETYDLTDDQASRLVDNFVTLGQLSGVLESRAHLFSWPLDGYYTCVNCAAVYDTPQSECTQCGHHFVTKLAYCNHCGEEALESWFCPDCERLSPLNVTSGEGRFEYFQDHTCSCGTETIRTVWRPYYECSGCWNQQKIDRITHCPDCDTAMVLSDDQDDLVCRNPECDVTQETGTEVVCENCHSNDLEPLSDDSVLYCEDCGDAHEQEAGHQCSCGGMLRPKRYLGWSCSDPDCDAVYFGEPPNTCDCGKRRFARTGLLDINAIDHCSNCDTDLLLGAECRCDDPAISPTVRGFREYKLVDELGQIRKPSSFHGAVPCYDPRKTYRKSSRYESMIRGPGNTAVTTAQYFLREIADVNEPDSFREAKMLSFADSQSDMKELNRNFTEPEQTLFVTQLVVDTLDETDDNWVSLSELQSTVIKRAVGYEDMLTEGDGGLLEAMTGYRQSVEDFLKEEVAARVLRGRYNNRWRSRDHLPSDGLLDVSLDIDLSDFDSGEMAVIEALNGQSKQYVESLSDDIEDAGRHVESLIDQDVLRRIETDSGYLIGFDESCVCCTTVDAETPITYVPATESFYSTLDEVFADHGPDLDTVTFSADYEARSEFTHPHFDLTAYRVNYSDPLLLVSRAYFGLTEKDERRRIEYQFREGRYPNFLSSGPAMEVGMDIGDLDALLLYGTPPNTNSYLQRIGRAGRQSGSSLVHSISQRNPIDYYYYEQPNELIQAKPQPVPLNETNEEVLRISLTWAILDYFAAECWIPWRRESSDVVDELYCEDDLVPRSEPRPNDIVTFTALLASENDAIQFVDEEAPLQTLKVAYEEHRTEVRDWLEDILGFSYCRDCGRKHEAGYEGPCSRPECDGRVVSAVNAHEDVIEEAMTTFVDEFVESYFDFEDDILNELDKVQTQLNELNLESRGRRNRRRQNSNDRVEQRDERDRLQSRSANLNQYLDRLARMDYGSFLEEHSTTPFSLRSVEDTVEYELIGEDFESVTADLHSRPIRIALSELHPGAAYLHSDNQRYVVTGVRAHSYQTSQLESTAAICPTCGAEYDLGEGPCEECGSDLKRLKTIVPERVTAYKSDLVLGQLPNGDPLLPTRLYQSDSEVQDTYAPTETNVTAFDPEPERAFAITTDDGDSVGRFDYGDVTINSSVRQFKAHYVGGGSDPLPNVFELCGKENCDGVIARDDETAYCMRHPEHSTENTDVVRLATEFDTKAVRIQFDDEDLEHAFSHGVRMALQYIGGVGVRAVPESLGEDGTYIFDNETGGSGVTVLLTMGSGNTREKFDTAISLIEDAFECSCDNGCPFCIYQYGCENQNDPET